MSRSTHLYAAQTLPLLRRGFPRATRVLGADLDPVNKVLHNTTGSRNDSERTESKIRSGISKQTPCSHPFSSQFYITSLFPCAELMESHHCSSETSHSFKHISTLLRQGPRAADGGLGLRVTGPSQACGARLWLDMGPFILPCQTISQDWNSL